MLNELGELWSKLLEALGWGGSSLGWVQLLFVALAIVGALVVLRNLLGGGASRGGGGGGSTTVYPQERGKGFPTSFYTGSSKLSDFSIKPEIYDFKVPSPEPKLDKLKEGPSLDMDMARKLFISSPVQGLRAQSRDEEMGRMPSSKGSTASRPDVVVVPQEGILSVLGPKVEGKISQSTSEEGDSTAFLPKGPDWELAQKLFVPNFSKRNRR